VEWILKLAAAGDEGPCVDIMEISKPDDLGDIANLRLTHMEAKQLLARVQREISTAQARQHAARRPVCPCRVHDAPVAPLSQSRRNPTGLEQRGCDDEAEAVVAVAASSKFAP